MSPPVPPRTCPSCGFDNAEHGKPCPLCGGSEVMEHTLVGDLPTREFPSSGRAPSAAGAVPPGEVAAGHVFAERYRVEELLGQGGMGQVFRVRDLREDRQAALKVLHSGADEDDPRRLDRFKREIGILSRIDHPAVPGILDWGTEGERLFFVTPLVDGEDLKLAIQRSGPAPVAEAVALVAAVAEALDAAHAAGIVHRDVKPSNIMVARDGAVSLLDFGLARGMGMDMTTLTRTGMIVGTPAYMAPEQFEGQVDERSDIYALGVVLFELLTGRLPFTGQTPLAVAMRHRSEPAPSPRKLRPELPVWLERVVLRCLEKEPARRYARSAELAEELRRPRGQAPQRRRLESGDTVVEDEAGASAWALVLASRRRKDGWSSGMALRFEDRYYRLEDEVPPGAAGPLWVYRFASWPETEVFRRLVDYEEDCRSRRGEGGSSSALKRWLTGRRQ